MTFYSLALSIIEPDKPLRIDYTGDFDLIILYGLQLRVVKEAKPFYGGVFEDPNVFNRGADTRQDEVYNIYRRSHNEAAALGGSKRRPSHCPKRGNRFCSDIVPAKASPCPYDQDINNKEPPYNYKGKKCWCCDACRKECAADI